MGSFVQHKNMFRGWNVLYVIYGQYPLILTKNKSGLYFVSLVSLLLPLSEHCITKTWGRFIKCA